MGTALSCNAQRPNRTNRGSKGEFFNQLVAFQEKQQEFLYLSKNSHFAEETIARLHQRFNNIDSEINEDGLISQEEFAKCLGMPSESILVCRFFKFFEDNGAQDGYINFRTFILGLSSLSQHATKEEKIQLSFNLYDVNRDGFIDWEELEKLVKAALHEVDMRLSESQIEALIKNTFEAADLNRDGKIDREEYHNFCDKNPRVLQPFTLNIELLIEEVWRERRERGPSVIEPPPLHHAGGPIDPNVARLPKKTSLFSANRDSIHNVRSIEDVTNVDFS